LRLRWSNLKSFRRGNLCPQVFHIKEILRSSGSQFGGNEILARDNPYLYFFERGANPL